MDRLPILVKILLHFLVRAIDDVNKGLKIKKDICKRKISFGHKEAKT